VLKNVSSGATDRSIAYHDGRHDREPEAMFGYLAAEERVPPDHPRRASPKRATPVHAPREVPPSATDRRAS
jgi:hypothetical protein